MTSTYTQPLAIDGGAPVRDRKVHPWPRWPIYDETEEQALLEVLHSDRWWYVEGKQGREIEQEFARFQGARYAVACTNGTAALEIALRALEIGCGDEVIVPPYTFVATASAVLSVDATPVFVDIDPDTLNIDPARIEEAITARTRAIIPVHIAGRPADLDAVLEIARRRGLHVIEDAAQAHAAAWRGTPVGAIGDFGTFSFQASKNLCAGEGGMILSNDERLIDAAWSITHVGRSRTGRWYEHPVLGSNFRLTEFQSALLRTQLRRLPEQTARRTESAQALTSQLAQVEGILLPRPDPRITTHAYHSFTFRYVPEAFGGRPLSEFTKSLNAEGVPCSSGYVPLYKEGVFTRHSSRQGPWCRAGRAIDYPHLALPACEQVCTDCVWMPQFLLLAPKGEMADVAEAITKIQTAWS